MLLQLLTGISILACLVSLSLPWYQQTLIEERTSEELTTTGTVYYQVFYFYSSPNCTSNSSCIIRFRNEYIGEIPNTAGFSIWQLDGEYLPSTRLLFAICWVFQLFSILFVPFSLTKGTKSNMGATLALISLGGSVILFFFLPTALERDYGSNCTNNSNAPLSPDYTPCNTFFHTATKEYQNEIIGMQWGPSFGFYLALGNILVQGSIFLVTAFLSPCYCCEKNTKYDWLYDDLLSESDCHLTGYSSTIPSDSESSTSVPSMQRQSLLPGPGSEQKTYNST